MKRKIFSVLLTLVLVLSFSLVTAVPAGAFPAAQTHTVTGDGAGGFTLAEMDQQFSTETVDASAGDTTLSGWVTLGNFEAGNGNDVWYEAGLVSDATYLGYSRLHNKGAYMIALWTGTGYIVHMQNVVGQQPLLTGNYSGDDVAYPDLGWGDAGLCYFQVPSAAFNYEIRYHDVLVDYGMVDLRISTDGGTTWSGWKLYQYAENDMENFYNLDHEVAVAYGYAGDDDLTNARIVSQIFVESTTTEIFTASYDNILVNNTPYVLAPRIKNVDTGKGYTAIQLAIDAPETDSNDTITVAAGTYNEQVVINESLTLQAASSPVIDGGGTLTNPAIHVNAASVKVEGFVIQNFIAKGQDGPGDIGAVLVEGDGAKVYSNIVRDITCTEETGPSPAGLGIDVSANNVEVIGNEVYNISSIGIRVRARFESPEIEKTGILLEDNTVHDTGNSGVLVVGYVTGIKIVGGNEIYDSLQPTPYSIFMLPFSGHGPSDVLIEGNTIYNGYGNICLGGVTGATIRGNTIYGAIAHYSDPANIKGKNIYIREWGGILTTGVTITNNNITGADGSGVNIKYTADGADMASTTTINYNNISGNSDYGVLNEIATDVDATKNYWGDASGPDGAQSFTEATYTGVLPGTGNKVSANVKCMPWLTRPFEEVIEDDIAYFGVSFPAQKGWNIVSAPLALDAHVTADGFTANTWGGLLNLGKAEGDDYALKLHYTGEGGERVYSPIYYYVSDPESDDFGWQEADESTVINPVDAFYIRMMASDSFPVLFSPDHSVPSKELYQGWNLVGCAYMDVMFAGAEGQPLLTALATIAEVSSLAGDVTGYSQVVSPPVNQQAWIYIPSSNTYIPTSTGEKILIGKGYWVFMENSGTLAGLTFTPISLPD